MKRLLSLACAPGIFCFALLVRLIYNNIVARDYYPTHDSLFYHTIAINILKERCFCLHPYIITVERTPLWPGILAVIYSVLGPHDYSARLFLCFIGSGTCVLVYLFARDLFGWRIGVLSGAVATIYPELFIYDGWLYTESLFTFLLFAFCYILYQLQQTPRGSRWIWCGILLGLMSLVRPNGLLVLGLFILWGIILGWIKILSWRVVAEGSVIVTLITLSLIVPWTIRNYNVSHTFIPVATGDGTVLIGAYNSMVLTTPSYPHGNVGTWIAPLISNPTVAGSYPLYTCDAPCEVAREDAFKGHAVQWIRDHMSSIPHLLQLHFINMWQPDTYELDLPTVRFPNQKSTQMLLPMMKSFPTYIFILAALGFLMTLRRWRELMFIYFIILLTIIECVIFYGIPRFRAPIEPILILLAAGVVWWLTHKEKGTLWWIVGRLRRHEVKGEQEITEIEASSSKSVIKR